MSAMKNDYKLAESYDGGNTWHTVPGLWGGQFNNIIFFPSTFFKMMIASGPYDDLLRAEMYRVRALSDKRIKEINDHIENEINISTAKNNARLTAEIGANKAVLEKLSTAQSQLIQEAIEEWKKQELEKVRNNPNVYINSNT